MVGLLSIKHLDFQTISIERVLQGGQTSRVSVEIGMPKIPQNVLQCTFFLHASYDDALEWKNPCGTGFIVADVVQSPFGVPFVHFYAISNWHVIAGAPVIRLFTQKGPAVFDFDPAIEWVYVPGGHPNQGDDVAVAYLNLADDQQVMAVPTSLFLMEDIARQRQIGVGDDVFMLGLFLDDYSRMAAMPKARFGHISAMPHDARPIKQPNHTTTKSSYILDMHSRTGFSGSPVFAYRTLGADLSQANSTKFVMNEPALFCFLGIHYGNFPETFKSTDEYGKEMRLEGLSGMSCAIPAWRVYDLLHHPGLTAARVAAEDGMRKKLGTIPRPM